VIGAGRQVFSGAPAGGAVVSTGSGRRLWPHQVDAVDSWCAAVGEGERATVVAACGTGKTLIAAEASARVAAGEPVVVTVPTVDLLAQTVGEWLDFLGRGVGRLVAVCNMRQMRQAARQAGVSLRGLQVTTDPGTLAGWMAAGRVTVVGTYASVAVIRAAYALHDARRAGLLVVDEAHRTAGEIGKPWAMVHDDVAVPARRRMYATATPRIVGDDQQAISMDDVKVFGPTAFRLGFADAIELGLLADYRLVVAVVTAEQITGLQAEQTLTVDGRPRPARMLASQIALARAINDYGLRRLLVYHNRVAVAGHFAQTLADAVALLPERERPQWPVVGWSAHGRSGFAHRAMVLRELREPGGNTVVVCNARLFTEGVDVPALDGVAFDEPRSSIIDVVQGVGRALRLGGQPGKTATVVVPVLTSEAALTRQLARRDWQTVWRVVRALGAHDERVEQRLQQARQTYRRHSPAGAVAGLDWLTAAGPGVPDDFADRIRLRVLTHGATERVQDGWAHYYPLVVAYHAEHGHLRIPSDPARAGLRSWLTRQRRLHAVGKLAPERVTALQRLGIVWEVGEHQWETRYAEYKRLHQQQQQGDKATASQSLTAWCSRQRALHRDGTLPPARKQLLDEVGFDWDPVQTEWDTAIAHLRTYRRQHGDLLVPQHLICDDGYQLGAWVSNRRSEMRSGQLRLSAARKAELDQLGMVWDAYEFRWQEGLTAARAFHAEHGHLRVPQDLVYGDNTHRLGNWISNRRADHRRGNLAPERKAELDRLGMDWDPPRTRRPDAAAPRPPQPEPLSAASGRVLR
jgi:superfamily II DNA or RNA helicase